MSIARVCMPLQWLVRQPTLEIICHCPRKGSTDVVFRGWAYILFSCALFLCEVEAAALKNEDLDVPTDPITGEIS